ncbi:CAAX protease self-immunity [Klenkia marina]|uniref:CAAX protease self-immunity n=1 Tax=Klenkia marina TaxID=1960309 RepID=A0A1G4YUM7_9ACTN|nr:CPBP family intramembrane glutamic endopeptidase [Klenkia marina]SCX57169.1 CAAX protease self-immunity [Klenkia marina]
MRFLPLTVVSGALLLWGVLVVPLLPEGPGARTAANLLAVAALLALTRLPRAELGLARGHVRPGLRWGGLVLAVVGTGYLVALAVPPVHALLDAAAELGTTAELLLRLLVFIPLGTVLAEELAFRGVLLGMALRRLPVRWAVVWCSVVFGLWHVSTARTPDAVDGAPATTLAVLGTVVATAVAGALFAWLRLRSGSLLAPVAAHLATNVLGLVAVAVAAR